MTLRVAYGLLFALVLLGAQASHAEWRREVLVTVEVLEPLMAELMQGAGTATTLTRSGANAHFTSLTVKQAATLASAEVIISPDQSMAPGLRKILTSRAKKGATIIYLSELKGAETLPYRRENPFLNVGELATHDVPEKKHRRKGNHGPHEHEHAHDHPHAKGAVDPHLWLDPLRMANLMPALAEKIAEVWPEAAPTLKKNATRIALRLRAEVYPGIQNLIIEARTRNRDDSKTIPFMTYHDAYQYFQVRYGITAGYITQRPEEYLGAKTMQQLLAKAKVSEVRCLISETDSTSVKRLAQLSRAQVKTLNPERSYSAGEVPITPWAKNDYDRMLLAITKTFAECM
ncbi:MAG: metal ABC transporter solute-binding protein, Zn/Mn family [Alphaproteobacteria bacterium]